MLSLFSVNSLALHAASCTLAVSALETCSSVHLLSDWQQARLAARVNFLACQSGLRPRRMVCFRRGRGFGCNHKPTPGISACKPFCRLGPPLCSKWLALTVRHLRL
ncbi:hypothetical protein DFH07DRAFT_830195 [Mycena maculata]|uniref:Secreted protein n=1 Tax=Mycena maculata TaxID=230809 RepID=A0AAD7IQD1_9AGAR|nr:hypothetical protein DFH07DRAFT_830195 [Mycena maculata]